MHVTDPALQGKGPSEKAFEMQACGYEQKGQASQSVFIGDGREAFFNHNCCDRLDRLLNTFRV